MRLMVPGAQKIVARLAAGESDRLGVFMVPGGGPGVRWAEATGLPYAADNGAFGDFDETAFRRMLRKLSGSRVRWVAVPDVVGDAAATLRRFGEWLPELRAAGLPAALVAQDGLTPAAVPWPDVACVFIGGTDGFKLSPQSAAVAAEATARGKWVHMGRVNSYRRMDLAARMGCDSVDGSSLSWFSETWVPKALAWLRRIERQPAFW